MAEPVRMVEVTRGGRVESVHLGHAVICRADGRIVEGWGDPATVIYPRSSCKMVQALPMVEAGVASLTDQRLALACASHQGAAIHTGPVADWLAEIGADEAALRCGAHRPKDRKTRDALIRAGREPDQTHNNCSGKHAGFVAFARHLGAGPDYIDIDHPVQRQVREAFEDVTGEESPGYGIDGCSAPNFATTMRGLARGMAQFADAGNRSGARAEAQTRLVEAMMAYPELVAGKGRACTRLMRAAKGKAAVKTGAEGVFVGIIPDQGLGIAVKAADGATRAAEAVIAALLVRLGVLDAQDPAALAYLDAPVTNWRGIEVGRIKSVGELTG
ncbi:asparaginase [Aestuariibius sp. 2305UL40-4]|uniref:asparaginase n=1 Tax=Aestuariibius violaceus TaxID=3234132 RepID=UPI00345E45E5